jgi:maleamate amidohydrolase
MSNLNRPFSEVIDEAYAIWNKRKLAGKVGYGKRPAILIGDFIRANIHPSEAFGCDSGTAIDACRDVLAIARRRKIPVLFTTPIWQPDMADAGLWVKKIGPIREFQAGSPTVEVDPRLERRESEPLIIKKYTSCFFHTDLLPRLINLRVDTIILFAASTSGCARATAVDGMGYGFHMIAVKEGVIDRVDLCHQAALFDIESRYGDVEPVADVLKYLNTVELPQ